MVLNLAEQRSCVFFALELTFPKSGSRKNPVKFRFIQENIWIDSICHSDRSRFQQASALSLRINSSAKSEVHSPSP